MRLLKGIVIAVIAIIIALALAIRSPWRTGGRTGETNPPGGSNIAQGPNNSAPGAQPANNPATGARDAGQSGKNAQQPAEGTSEAKQQGANKPEAKQRQRSKGAKRATAKMRREARQTGEYCECQCVETPYVENCELQYVGAQVVKQVVINVMQPAEDGETDSIETQVVIDQQVTQPRDSQLDVEYMEDSSDWSSSHRIILDVPERQECETPREVWVEVR
jgi:hypothetical protein